MKPFLALLLFTALFARVAAAPVNDAFAARLSIPATLGGTPSLASGDLAKATLESQEPSHAERTNTKSLWWTWTAPEDGILELTTQGSDVSTSLALYTGTQVSKLVVVAHDRDSGASDSSLIRVGIQAGTVYQIAVAGNSNGRVKLRLTHFTTAGVANDQFAQRISLAGGYTQATGSNVEASKEIDEPAHAGNVGGKSVWWSWTAPASGNVTVTTQGSTAAADRDEDEDQVQAIALDTIVGVYTGAKVSTLTPIASNDNPPGNSGLHSVVNFYAIEGVTYQIAVDGFRDPDTGAAKGAIALKITLVRANDKFGARYPITSPSALVTGVSNLHAGKETGEPQHAGNAGGKSVWWTWTAPSTGTVTLSTANSTFDTLLAVYTGTAVNALTLIAEDNNSGAANTSVIEFPVVAKQQYQIAVDGAKALGGQAVAVGTISLSLQFVSHFPSIKTQPANASVVVGGSATFTLDALGKAPLTYTWQRRLAGTTAWTTLPAQTVSDFPLVAIPQSANGDAFRCIVSNDVGAVTSAVATLKVTPKAPAITLPATLRVRGTVTIPSAPADAPVSLKYYASPLPPGLTINRDTGVITGTITKAGTFTVTYWSQDGTVKSVLKTIIFTVLPIPAPMSGGFEALLVEGDEDTGLPAGKLTLNVADAGTFTGTLVTADVKSFALKGALALNADFSLATATLTLKRAGLEPYTLALTVSDAAVLSAELRELAVVKGATTEGVKLAVTSAAPGAGLHTTTLRAESLDVEDPRPIPAGAGYATGSIAPGGLLKLTGKLADGARLTASLARGSDAIYRLYAKPYKTVGNALAGHLPLTARADNATLFHVRTEDVYWTKPANPKDTAYAAGFGPLSVTVSLERWVKPATGVTLGTKLGLPLNGTGYEFTVAIEGAGISNASPNDRELPTGLLLTSQNLVAVPASTPPAPVNPSAWRTTVNLATGSFTGGFKVSDGTPAVKRTIIIQGVLQQLPADSESKVFGCGYFLAPPVVKGGPTLSGLIEFTPPAP